VIPERVTAELLQLLRDTRTAVSIVLHVNHPNEIAGHFVDALAALHRAGITLLNQSVLLAGVNDDVDVLDELSQRLFDNHVLPYYLHLPDPVLGTHHFDVPEASGVALVAALRARLPGYLVPRLVREIAGRDAKTIIAPT
jgi:KamA family protein